MIIDPTSCTVHIFDSTGTEIQTLSSSSPDANGVFWQTWPTGGLDESALYFAKVDVLHSSTTYSSGLSYSINIPKAIAGLGTTVGEDIAAMQTAIEASLTAGLSDTVSQISTDISTLSTSIGSNLSTQTTQIQADISALETSIGTDLGDTTTAIQADVADVKSDLTALSNAQATFRSATTTSLANLESDVGAILEDTGTTLPEQIATDVAGALAKGVQAEILTRPTTVKTGSTATIRFRTTTGLSPTIIVYDASNTARVSSASMTEIGTTGIYEYDLSLLADWGTGDYTIICNESTKQSVDSMVLTVSSVDLASVSADIASIATTLDSMDTKIDTLDTNVDSLVTTVSTINTNTSSVGTDVDTLLTRLGTISDTSSSSTVFGAIEAVDTVLGTTSDTSSSNTVFGKIAGIASDVDAIGPDATNASTYALTAKTQATTAASTAAEIKTLVTAGRGSETYAGVQKLQSDLSALQATMNRIPEAVSTESITASIKTALGKLNEIAAKEGYERLVPGAEGLQPGLAASSADMQQIRNSIAELKALMGQVRGLLDRKVNAPVVRSWMEGR